MMRKFYQNKLWRSKLIAQRQADGAVVHTIPLSHEQMGEELKIKLLEEAQGAYEAENQNDMINEIADILEAIDCILKYHKISKDTVLALKEEKLANLGSYTDPRLVDYVEYPAGSAEEKHCLEHPNLYPELTDEESDHHEINNCCK